MSTVKNYIGIDISKNWLDISVLRPKYGIDLQLKIDNNIKQFKALKKTLRGRRD
jgi:hypothetical protein